MTENLNLNKPNSVILSQQIENFPTKDLQPSSSFSSGILPTGHDCNPTLSKQTLLLQSCIKESEKNLLHWRGRKSFILGQLRNLDIDFSSCQNQLNEYEHTILNIQHSIKNLNRYPWNAIYCIIKETHSFSSLEWFKLDFCWAFKLLETQQHQVII